MRITTISRRRIINRDSSREKSHVIKTINVSIILKNIILKCGVNFIKIDFNPNVNINSLHHPNTQQKLEIR